MTSEDALKEGGARRAAFSTTKSRGGSEQSPATPDPRRDSPRPRAVPDKILDRLVRVRWYKPTELLCACEGRDCFHRFALPGRVAVHVDRKNEDRTDGNNVACGGCDSRRGGRRFLVKSATATERTSVARESPAVNRLRIIERWLAFDCFLDEFSMTCRPSSFYLHNPERPLWFALVRRIWLLVAFGCGPAGTRKARRASTSAS